MTRSEAQATVAKVVSDRRGSYPSQNEKWDITDRTRHQHRRVKDSGAERAILSADDRADAVELARDLHRNDATLATILWQLACNVVGPSGGKASFWSASDPEWAKTATSWYNQTWAKDCDGQGLHTHWSTQLSTGLTSMLREGDCLLLFDDFLADDGCCHWYEADELVLIDKKDWALNAVRRGLVQPDPSDRRKRIPLDHTSPGIVRDKMGRVTHFVVSTSRKTKVRWEDATIIRADSAVLLRMPFRFGQHRGTAKAWTVHDTLADIKEGTAEELRSLRELNKKAIIVQQDNEVEEQLSRFGTSMDEVVEAVEKGETAAADILKNKRYESLENLYEHASTTYLGKDEKATVVQSDRPAMAMQSFWTDQRVLSGAAFGLARCYTLLSVSNNFSSARAEFIISWATFVVYQKLLERLVCDWTTAKAVAWAIRKGRLQPGPSDWSVSFSWPKMPMIDVAKEIRGLREKIAAGLTTWQEVLGPEYLKLFEQLAKEMGELKDIGLDRLLDMFFTVAGASKEQTVENAITEAFDNQGV